MATEPSLDRPEASHTELALTQPDFSNTDAHDDNYPNAKLNGTPFDIEHKQVAELVDEIVHSAEVSVSGGSDTEASKADPLKRFGDKNHARSSSTVKKPQSFKSVSVNRTFLASKAASNSSSRPDSTGSASTTPQPTPTISASRLKLVAKSGSSLGGSTKTLSSNGKPATAPDPNTVWNRNKPISQPEQKKLSDEELMNQYGIHMAGRLGPEDTKGQSNWADIDDDEEWAPETITWTDGTKITLPQAEESVPSPSIAPATLEKEPIASPPKSKSPVPVTSTIGSPSVKPGVLASGKGLILKGAPEKPTLVAKPPAPPTPAKSPWARLPPIEKVPPGQVDASSSAAGISRVPARDFTLANSANPQLTKEIAADDFSRSGYREGHANNHSQLFNSHSGRYEPVTDRRGSRNDIHGRQPAVLQRPHHHDQQGPAEPSAAFQTSRSGGHEAPYGRRRGSSNVSGTSGTLAYKLGKPHDMPLPPSDLLQSRSGSVVGTGAESPISARTFSPPNNQQTPLLHSSQPYQPRASPGQMHATSYDPSKSNVDDDFESQKKIMREKREEAIKRRLEEEAIEEEARKARIAEKLKAMGPAPERKSAKKDVKGEVSMQSLPTGRTSIPPALQMKASASQEASSEAGHSKPNTIPSTGSTKPNTSQRINGDDKRVFSQGEKVTAEVPNTQPKASWPEAPQHPERFPSWSGASQNSSRNVWGAPGNDRSLGNGTFNPDLGILPDSHPAPLNERSHRPAPIGPPRSASQRSTRPETLSSGRLVPIGPPRERNSNMAQASGKSANPWASFASNVEEDDARRAMEMQKKINAAAKLSTQPVSDFWRPDSGAKATLVTHLGTETKMDEPTAENMSKHQVIAQTEGPNGLDVAKYKSTSRTSTTRGVNGIATAPGPATQSRSGSRFFPQFRDASQSNHHSSQEDARTKSPTPPPPTADGHPVFDGDVNRPHVSLPPTRPVVKLPPSTSSTTTSPLMQTGRPAPVSFAAAAAAPIQAGSRSGSRNAGYGSIPQKPHEIASQANWQDKINNLMGKKVTLAATKSMAVDSSSRIALEHVQQYDPATVALPGPSFSFSPAIPNHGHFTSKEMAEECFGEQEMGSLPAVRLPSEAPDALWQAVEPNFDPAPPKLRVDATGAETLRFPPETSNGKSVIRVSVPFMSEPKTVPAPSLSNSNTPRRPGPRGSPRRAPGRGGQRGGRDQHSSHAGDHTSPHSSSRPPSTRSSRGGYRPRTENWGRQSTASTAQS